jgi:hypothetical protein
MTATGARVGQERKREKKLERLAADSVNST